MEKSRKEWGIWKKFQATSMRRALLAAFFVLGFFLTLAVSYIGYYTFERTLISEIGNNRLDVLRQIGERVRQVEYSARTLSNLYYYDETLQNSLKSGNLENLESYMDRLTNQYNSSFFEDSMQFRVILALDQGGGYSSEHEPENYDYMSPKTKIWYKRMLDAQGGIVDIANYRDKETGRDYFTEARVFLDEEGKSLAYLMLSVEENRFRSMYEPMTRLKQNTVYIVDETGTVISCSKENLNGFNLFNMKNLDSLFGKSAYTFTNMRGEDILFTRYREPESGFTVLEEIPLRMLMEPIREVRLVIAVVAVLAVGAAFAYGWQFTRQVTKPISQLCDFMLQVDEENLDEPCEVEGHTEIKILRNRLNMMLARMKELMDGIKQKEKQKRRLELRFLQAQINPHFLYNTLFSIKCMVDMEKNEDASKMLATFIQLLRKTLSNPHEFVTVREELDSLEQYVEIQKFRYQDGFSVVYECDEELMEKKIPKLLMQPLLENAIFHGVEFKKEDGLIIVTVRENGGDLMITVEDNGLGITPEVLERLRQGKQETSEGRHVGLGNVKERIQLNFGENYGMEIESVQWQGTKVILLLPSMD